MRPLSKLERRILAVLEEAGEESIGTIMNTVAVPKGECKELIAMQKALRNLLLDGLVTLGYELLPISCTTNRLCYTDSMILLDRLAGVLKWSPSAGFWIGAEGVPLYNIELTDSGYQRACHILEEDGYPIEPLVEYE